MDKVARIAPIRTIPLGEGYASTAVNTTIFRHDGLVTWENRQFGAYYVSDKEIAVFHRNLRDDAVEIGAIRGLFNAADVHNCISVGVDASGFIHVAYNHHGDSLKYRRSRHSRNVTEWTEETPMTGRLEDQVTYPQFLMCPNAVADGALKGSLLFLYRHVQSGNGDMCLKQYSPDTQTWMDVSECFVKGTGQVPWTSNAYWNHPAFDSHGQLLLSWVWRVVQNASAKGDFIFNHNHGFAKSPDGRRWFTSRGVELALPMTQVNSEIIWPTTPGATIANMCSSAVDSADRLHIAGYGADEPGGAPQYQHVWFDGSAWRSTALTRRTEAFGLLTWDSPMSRPEILIDRRDRVYFIYRCDLTRNRLVVQRLDPPAYEPSNALFELWPDELGHSEPIVDRQRWAHDGTLSMLVQRTTQPELTAERETDPELVRIVDWKLSLEDAG